MIKRFLLGLTLLTNTLICHADLTFSAPSGPFKSQLFSNSMAATEVIDDKKIIENTKIQDLKFPVPDLGRYQEKDNALNLNNLNSASNRNNQQANFNNLNPISNTDRNESVMPNFNFESEEQNIWQSNSKDPIIDNTQTSVTANVQSSFDDLKIETAPSNENIQSYPLEWGNSNLPLPTGNQANLMNNPKQINQFKDQQQNYMPEQNGYFPNEFNQNRYHSNGMNQNDYFQNGTNFNQNNLNQQMYNQNGYYPNPNGYNQSMDQFNPNNFMQNPMMGMPFPQSMMPWPTN